MIQSAEYSAYGCELPGWNYHSVLGYRYGFQGQEHDDEITGTSTQIAFKYRIEDARIGRFFSIDPLTASYPHYSSYSFSGNRLIDMIELEGLGPIGHYGMWTTLHDYGNKANWKCEAKMLLIQDVDAAKTTYFVHISKLGNIEQYQWFDGKKIDGQWVGEWKVFTPEGFISVNDAVEMSAENAVEEHIYKEHFEDFQETMASIDRMYEGGTYVIAGVACAPGLYYMGVYASPYLASGARLGLSGLRYLSPYVRSGFNWFYKTQLSFNVGGAASDAVAQRIVNGSWEDVNWAQTGSELIFKRWYVSAVVGSISEINYANGDFTAAIQSHKDIISGSIFNLLGNGFGEVYGMYLRKLYGDVFNSTIGKQSVDAAVSFPGDSGSSVIQDSFDSQNE